MKVHTLYPVRRAPHYAMSLEKTAAEGQPNISGDLGKLIGKFLERVNQVVGPHSNNPVGDIQDELGIARMDYFSDVDFLMGLFAQNPLIGRTPLSSILPDPLPENISLLNIVGSAVDRLLLQVATKWHKKQYGDVQQKAGSADSFYLYYGDIPCYIFRQRTAGTDELPFNSQELMVLTTNYMNQLYKLHERWPKLSEQEIMDKYPPNHKDLSPVAVGKAIAAEPSLAFVNIAPILKEYQHGDVYSAAKAALDAAVVANTKAVVKSGGWTSRPLDEQMKLDEEKFERMQQEEQGTVPGKRLNAPTSTMPQQSPMPMQTDTGTRPAV